MGTNIAYKMVLPDWTKQLSGETLMDSKDVAGFFGFKSVSSLHQNRHAHRFPPKTDFKSKFMCHGRKPKSFYKLKDLREFERKQNESENKEEI